MSDIQFLETAIAAARMGGNILKENFGGERHRQISEKAEFDFVTQVDLLSENKIMAYLRQRHPDHDILAEESGGERIKQGYLWIIDPLDGTKNYIHGFPFFSVSVALFLNGKPVVGAIYDPVRDELFHASKGGGAFRNDQPMQVTATSQKSQFLLATGFPFRAKHLAKPYFTAFASLFDVVSDMRRAGSAALDLAYVACGRLDGFWEVDLNIWDIAAGVLLIEEAGGKVTGFRGQEDYLASGHIIATNGHTEALILEHTNAAFAGVEF